MNNFDGYYESESTTQSRAWRIALESVGYFPTLHTEAEADALANLIDVSNSVPLRELFGGWNVTATAEWRRRHLNEE